MATSKGNSQWELPNELYGSLTCTCSVSADSSDVHVSMNLEQVPAGEARYDWEMYLQRDSGSGYNTVGSRTGWLSDDSPSHRTFTNVGQPGSDMRVYVYFPGNGSGFHYFTR